MNGKKNCSVSYKVFHKKLHNYFSKKFKTASKLKKELLWTQIILLSENTARNVI